LKKEATMTHAARPSTGGGSFKFKQHGKSKKQGRQGDYVFNPRYRNSVEGWVPSWNHTTTVFRPYPVVSQEDEGQLTEYRYSSAPDDFGDWIRGYPAVRNFGSKGLTYLLYDPRDETYDPATNPAWVLFRAIKGARDAGTADAKWAPLLEGGAGRGAELRAPSDLYLMQGALLEHRGKSYSPPRGGAQNDDLVVLEMGPSCYDRLSTLLNTRVDGATEDGTWDEMFTHGDPISLEEGKGKFISFYQAGGAADPSMQAQSGSFGESRDTGTRENRVFGFGCTIYDEWNGVPADLSGVADMVRGKAMAWDELINIMPDEDQAALLCDSFAPDVIEYGFRDFPEWITDRVRTKLSAAASFTQPVTTYQQPTPEPAAPASTADEAFGAPVGAAPPTTDAGTETTAGGFGSVRGATGATAETQDPIVPTGSIPEDAAVRPGSAQAVMDAAREAVRAQQSE
jgi:hypothetical protein